MSDATDPVIHDSRRFTVDGWRYDLSTGLRSVVTAAIGEVGICEVPPGSNAGPVLRYGGAPGEPWCALFVSWCYRAAGAPFGRLASAYKLREWASEHGRILPVGAQLLPGDIALVLREDLHGHAALIVADLGGGRIATVEGNVHSAVRGLVHTFAAEFACAIRPIP